MSTTLTNKGEAELLTIEAFLIRDEPAETRPDEGYANMMAQYMLENGIEGENGVYSEDDLAEAYEYAQGRIDG
jgi:hypothetical protein